VRRNVLADEVYEVLRQGLVSRQMAPGSRLNLDQLARELHVSNTPVRQALARLESEGLVTKEPYRGFAASPMLDTRTVVELYECRQLLEPPTAGRAAVHRTDADAAGLDELCDEETVSRLAAVYSTDKTLAHRDVEFHLAVAEMAGNSVVVEHMDLILTKMSRYSAYGQTEAWKQAWREHRAVAEAIRAKDAEGAARAMRTHLASGLERMRRAVS
jgi:DNA-binding GntR family transcriptional regulator